MQNNTFSGLIVGQKIVTLTIVDSTNNYVKKELAKSTPLTEGTVILAEHQYAGRGQINKSWHSEPGQNLTFSILLTPSFLVPTNQFTLNKAVSIGINDVLTPIIGNDVKIKWPNDVYFKDNKLGGILIENIIRASNWKYAIIGIGLNVNQENFPEELKNATSLKKILHQHYDIRDLLMEICKAIEFRYRQLMNGEFDLLHKTYLERLYRINEIVPFRVGEEIRQGKITDVTPTGALQVDFEEERLTFGIKEIEFIIDR